MDRTMKSLLNKTFLQFVVCTLVILLLATPIFYLLTKNFYAEDMIDLIEAMEHNSKVPHLDLERDILKGLMIQFFLIFIVLSCSLLITLRIVTHKLWRPFDDKQKKMEQFNLEQNTEPQFLSTKIKEFNRLNKSVSLLIRRDRQSYRMQKEFTENASHELQTPLAIAQSKLDLLLQENLTEAQSEIVSDLYRALNRMSRLNKNLLLLAKIENAQYYNLEKIDLCQFIERQLPLFNNLRGNNSSISFKKEENPLIIQANEVLLESMLNNLVINAIRHTTDDNSIIIEIKHNSLSILNSTQDGPLDKNKIFRRFQFTDNKKRGNGLGLPIVKAICDFHHWVINYEYQNGYHCFYIIFPN